MLTSVGRYGIIEIGDNDYKYAQISYKCTHQATLKDVERFSKGHFERYREFIVKLIVNYLSNKLPILSKANYILTNYTGSTTTNDSTNECQQSSIEEKVKIVSILSEEDKRRCFFCRF